LRVLDARREWNPSGIRAEEGGRYALSDEEAPTFFLIGEATLLQAPRTGELEAFANDWPGRYSNNKGRVTLVVHRVG
jgi:hypothetical protein